MTVPACPCCSRPLVAGRLNASPRWQCPDPDCPVDFASGSDWPDPADGPKKAVSGPANAIRAAGRTECLPGLDVAQEGE